MKVKKNQDGTLTAPYTPAMYQRDNPTASIPRQMWPTIDLTGESIYDVEPPVTEPGNPFVEVAERTVEEYAPLQFRLTYDTSPVPADLFEVRKSAYKRRIKSHALRLLRDASDLELSPFQAQVTATAAWRLAKGLNVPAAITNMADAASADLIAQVAPIYQAMVSITQEFDADPGAFYASWGNDVANHTTWP